MSSFRNSETNRGTVKGNRYGAAQDYTGRRSSRSDMSESMMFNKHPKKSNRSRQQDSGHTSSRRSAIDVMRDSIDQSIKSGAPSKTTKRPKKKSSKPVLQDQVNKYQQDYSYR